jgi:hypothetical protein
VALPEISIRVRALPHPQSDAFGRAMGVTNTVTGAVGGDVDHVGRNLQTSRFESSTNSSGKKRNSIDSPTSVASRCSGDPGVDATRLRVGSARCPCAQVK